MIQVTNIDVIEKNKDEESGDIYYTVEANIIEPGALFADNPSTPQLRQKLEEELNDGLKYLKEVIK